jgi:hypothetical protein
MPPKTVFPTQKYNTINIVLQQKDLTAPESINFQSTLAQSKFLHT